MKLAFYHTYTCWLVTVAIWHEADCELFIINPR